MVYFLKYITRQTKLGHINAMKDGIPSSYVPLKLSQMPSLLFFLLFTVYFLLNARLKKKVFDYLLLRLCRSQG